MCICLVIPSTDLAQIRSAWLTLHIVKVLDSGATAAVVHMLAAGQPGPFLWAGLLHTKGVQDARSTTAPFCQGLCGQSSSSSSLWERWRHAEGEHNKCRLQLLYIGENTMIHAAEFKQLKPVPEGKPAACRGSAQGVQSTTASRHQRPVYIQQSASAGMATHFNMHGRDPCLTERPDIHAFMTCSDLQNQQDMDIPAELWSLPVGVSLHTNTFQQIDAAAHLLAEVVACAARHGHNRASQAAWSRRWLSSWAVHACGWA